MFEYPYFAGYLYLTKLSAYLVSSESGIGNNKILGRQSKLGKNFTQV